MTTLCDNCPYRSQQSEVDVLRQACVDLGIRFVPPDWVSIVNAGKLLGRSPRTVENLIASKEIPARKMLGRVYVSLETIAHLRLGLRFEA